MGFLDRIKAWLSSEATEAGALSDELEQRWHADLDRRETELTATPEERMAMLDDDIKANDAVFDDLRSKLDDDIQ